MAEATTVHAAIEGQGCTACHDAHGSSEKALLLEGMPELCFSCHDKVEDAALRSRKRHAALFREGSCAECHEVHASREKHLLPQRQDKVCLRCHGQEDTSRSNPLKNISAEIEGKKQVHGPLVEGECSACHQPHGGDNFRLLTKSYPETFYAPYEKGVYDFCLQCHEKNLLRYEETSLYTGFRNGKQNLHYLHVNNQRKGRTCRTCHGPHGSDVSHLLHEAGASFGDWNIPLKFVPNENGGSCTPGCHRQVQYDREQPVDYRQ
jgi:predicted CXXCH cytochrome family protein